MLTDNFAFISNYVCRESIKNLNKHLSESELKSFSNNDYYYLATIYNLGKPNFSQIADELGLTKPAISVLVKKLMKMNLIEKVQSEEDKRVYYIKEKHNEHTNTITLSCHYFSNSNFFYSV